MAPDRPTVRLVAVAGGTGCGKTVLTGLIQEHFGPDRVTVVHQDHYYRDRSDLPPAARDALNFDHPDAIGFDLLHDHLVQLIAGHEVDRPTYDFVTHTRTGQTVRLSPAPLIVVDGILILHPPKLRSLFDLSIYLHAQHDTMLARRAVRDKAHRGRPADDAAAKPFEQHVLPMHVQFVEPTGAHADCVIDTTHPDAARAREAIEKIETLLQ